MTRPRTDIDMTTLAVQARTILASGRCALLTLPSDHIRGWVGLIDDGGEPLLVVGADSRPTRAAEAGRHARVDIPGHNGERLVLAGALRPMPGTAEQVVQRLGNLGRAVVTADGGINQLRVLAVAVDEVLICLPAGPDRAPAVAAGATGRQGGRSLTSRWSALGPARRVDLTSYALAEPDLVAAYAPDLIEHLNTEHADQMRQLCAHGAAPGTDRGADEIIGASVAALDRAGMDMWRIGPDGADQVRVTFRSPLVEPRSLGHELRRLLNEAERGSE